MLKQSLFAIVLLNSLSSQQLAAEVRASEERLEDQQSIENIPAISTSRLNPSATELVTFATVLAPVFASAEAKQLAGAVELRLRKGDDASAERLLKRYVEASNFAILVSGLKG